MHTLADVMDEDDTFAKLRQVPFAELDRIINEMSFPDFEMLVRDKNRKIAFLQSHGWTLYEYSSVVAARGY